MGATGAGRRGSAPPPHTALLLLLLLLSPLPPQALAIRLPLREVATLLSLSHSLLSRVAAAREARGDAAAAARVRRLASHLSLFSGGGGAWSLSWDYFRHYAFSAGAISGAGAASRLLAAVTEVSRLRTSAEAAQWLRRNYADVSAAAAQLLNSLLAAFSKEGPLREVVMDLKWEVEERDLLKDCLEIGAKDLEGLLAIANDLLFGSSASTSHDSEL